MQKFRSYEIAEDPKGNSLELWRTEREVVCLASEPARRQFVELHVITTVDAGDSAAVEAFRERAQRLLRINHPNVVEVRESGVDDGTLFWTCAFVDGEPLDSFLARCNPLPAWFAVEMARQIVVGLSAVKHEPALLAGADLFNARLVLDGDATADLAVRLVDFDLGGATAGALPEPREIERRAVKNVGRLLVYALSGLVTEKLTGRALATLPVPAELSQLIVRLLDPAARPQLSSLETLLRALEGCQKSLTLSTRPDRLPQTLRPRLPLQPHFLTLAQLVEPLGSAWRLERTAFDATQPYAQRAFGAGSRAAMAQLLPPVRLMAADWLPQVRLAAERVREADHPRLVRVEQIADGDEPLWFVEEARHRLTLEAVRRLRKQLSGGEAAFLLRELDRAVQEAEKLGLPAAIVSPQHVFVDFTGKDAALAEAELAATPVDQWPGFILRVRTHPVPLQFTQPARFLKERLLARGPRVRLENGTAGLGTPSAADYAAVYLWLCGGEPGLPGELAAVVPRTIDGSGEPDRRKLSDLIFAHVPKPVRKTAPKPAPKPAETPAPPAAKVKLATKEAKKATPAPVPAKPAAKTARKAAKPTAAAEKTKPSTTSRPSAADPAAIAPAAAAPAFGALSASADVEPEDTEAAGGFAEILFGGAPAEEPEPARASTPTLSFSDADATDPDAESEPLAMGAFLGNLAPGEPGDGDLAPLDFDPYDRGVPGLPLGLILLVVVCALVIAVIAAHMFGLAPWSR